MSNIRTSTSHHSGWIIAVLFLALVGPAHAGDGVIEINQAKALAGGATPGDTAGFPVTLSQAGSYRLTGNLTLPDADTDGILIGTDHITIDLNGFAIIGPTVCTSTPNTPTTTCSNTGSGSGITGGGIGFAPENINILNGTVRGAGASGIAFIFGRVERIRAISNGVFGIEIPIGAAVDGSAPGNAIVESWAIRNGLGGISAGERSRVEGNVSSFNGGDGIACTDGCVVKDNATNSNGGSGISCSLGCAVANNTAFANKGSGISAFDGSVRGNTARGNTGFGLELPGSGYAENLSNANTGGAVSGGIETGGNVCNGTSTCP